MKPIQTDFSVYRKFNFENPPVAIKYLFFKPEGIKPLGKVGPAGYEQHLL